MEKPTISIGRIPIIKERIAELDQKLSNPCLLQPIRVWLWNRRQAWHDLLTKNGIAA